MIDELFDMTDFEQSLKEHVDDFTLVPSKKVWQGIYNTMHPGRRWPSIPMAFMLLLSLLGITYLNTSTIQQSPNEINLNSKNLSSTSNGIENNSPANHLTVASINKQYTTPANSSLVPIILNKVNSNSDEFQNNGNQFITDNKNAQQQPIIPGQEFVQKTVNSFDQLPIIGLENEMLVNKKSKNFETELLEKPAIIFPVPVAQNNSDGQKKSAASNMAKSIKKAPKITFSYFIMPTVTNAYFTGNEGKIKDESSIITINPKIPRSTRIVNAQLGLRLGGQVEYRLNSKFQVLLMGQASYSGYTVISNEEKLATGKLTLQDKSGPVYTKAYFTSYGNGKGENQVPLKNYSIQVSLPIGIQYEIWKNKSAAIFVNAGAGPSFVLKSNAHLLSSDGRNYVDDQSLMRKSNYAGFLGTNIQFHAKNLKWRIGPTISYQLLSSYEDIYPVKEHLIDYGIKIGISK